MADDGSAGAQEPPATRSLSALRFDASDLMTSAVGVGTFWDGVVDYNGRQDLDRAVAIIESDYDDAEG